MSGQRFRKKPVVIEAVQYDPLDQEAVIDFMKPNGQWRNSLGFQILTLEGVMRVDPGDWVIKGVKGEFYPCKPDIFALTYEKAGE